MGLLLQTDYALRTLLYLATTRERGTIQEISEYFQISADHIAKVVNQLNRLGYIRSIRGIGGGIELARKPEEITVGEVVLAFEGNLHLLSCVAREGICVIESFCKLKRVFAEAERIQFEYLQGVTLRDICPTKKQFDRISSEGSEG